MKKTNETKNAPKTPAYARILALVLAGIVGFGAIATAIGLIVAQFVG